MALLLLADPSEDKIRAYLPGSRCFVASNGAEMVAACVVKPLGGGCHELMSIAVPPTHQKQGHGAALLQWVIAFFRKAGAHQLEVGTGSFGYQLAFYQRYGFRVSSIERDFFVNNYPLPKTASRCWTCCASHCNTLARPDDGLLRLKRPVICCWKPDFSARMNAFWA